MYMNEVCGGGGAILFEILICILCSITEGNVAILKAKVKCAGAV